jgi:predicted nucleic acid-binding protein
VTPIRLVLDTDVVAAAVMAEFPTGEQAIRLLAGRWNFFAPSHWKEEFCNVIWKAVQLKRLGADEIDEIISRANALPIESVDIGELWRGAVARAIASDHPAYDTLFVELAIRPGNERGKLRQALAAEVSIDSKEPRRSPGIVTAESQRETDCGSSMVREGGLEPPRGCPHKVLSLARLPFRHSRGQIGKPAEKLYMEAAT